MKKDLKDLKQRFMNNHEKMMKLLQQLQEGTVSVEDAKTVLEQLIKEREALNEEFKEIALYQ